MINSFQPIYNKLSSMERTLHEIRKSKSNIDLPEEDHITIDQAEKILHLSRKRIYAIQGKFTVKKPGRKLIFSKKELLAYINGDSKKAV